MCYLKLINSSFMLSLIVIITISTLAIYTQNFYRQENDNLFVFQNFLFLISLIYFTIILKLHGIKSFLNTLYFSLWFLFFFQLSCKCIGYFAGIGGELTANRNSISYLALLLFLLNIHYLKNKTNQTLFLVLLFSIINSCKGVIFLLLIIFINYLVSKYFKKLIQFKKFYIATVILISLIISYFGIYLLLYIINVKLDDLSSIEHLRWGIPDEVGSLISRLGSVPYTLKNWFYSNQLFGIGTKASSELLYWGYPSHNYFVTMISIIGICGIIHTIFFVYMFYRICIYDINLGITGLFYILMSNDLNLLVLLCLVPLVPNRNIFHNKMLLNNFKYEHL